MGLATLKQASPTSLRPNLATLNLATLNFAMPNLNTYFLAQLASPNLLHPTHFPPSRYAQLSSILQTHLFGTVENMIVVMRQ